MNAVRGLRLAPSQPLLGAALTVSVLLLRLALGQFRRRDDPTPS